MLPNFDLWLVHHVNHTEDMEVFEYCLVHKGKEVRIKSQTCVGLEVASLREESPVGTGHFQFLDPSLYRIGDLRRCRTRLIPGDLTKTKLRSCWSVTSSQETLSVV